MNILRCLKWTWWRQAIHDLAHRDYPQNLRFNPATKGIYRQCSFCAFESEEV